MMAYITQQVNAQFSQHAAYSFLTSRYPFRVVVVDFCLYPQKIMSRLFIPAEYFKIKKIPSLQTFYLMGDFLFFNPEKSYRILYTTQACQDFSENKH